MKVNQGAIQLQVIIDGKSLTISKKYLSSLHVKRTFGESANEFTLEVFDETAYKVESLLIGSDFPSISVKYSASDSFNNTLLFTGICLDYNTTFVGRGMMLTITGILAATDEAFAGWWFERAAIEWCGSEPYFDDATQEWYVDGKSFSQTQDFKDNEDVCAIMVWDDGVDKSLSTNPPTVYFNPTRIFKRIIHKYNGDKLGSTYTTTQTVGSYDASTVSSTQVSCWNYFRSKGFSAEATAGILGNIQQESGFKTDVLQYGSGHAAGLFQWESYKNKSGRWLDLYNYAANLGKSWTDLQTQLDFAYNREMGSAFNTYTGFTKQYVDSNTGVGGNYYGWATKMTIDDYKKISDINVATQIFMQVFERPSDLVTVNGVRKHRPSLPKRKQYANAIYTNLKNSGLTGKQANDSVVVQTNVDYRLSPSIQMDVVGTIPRGSKVLILETVGDWYCVKYNDTSCYVRKAALLNTQEVKGTVSSNTASNTIAGWGEGGTGRFKIAEADESRWIANLTTVQQANQTAAQYITQVLCKNAVTDSGSGTKYEDETAGFKYFVDAKGHHFVSLNYNGSVKAQINVSYGLKESQIISFSISNIGSVAMVWGNSTKRNSVNVTSSALSDIYGDQITSGGENILGQNLTEEVISNSNKSILNWYLDAVPAVQVKSSTSESELETTVKSIYSDLSDFAITAELTIWGQYSKTYTPGDYISLIVMTANNYRHYSSGVYMITNLEDNISSSGYTQTMRLLKLVGDNVSTSSGAASSEDLVIDDNGHIVSYTQPHEIMEPSLVPDNMPTKNKAAEFVENSWMSSFLLKQKNDIEKAKVEGSDMRETIVITLADIYSSKTSLPIYSVTKVPTGSTVTVILEDGDWCWVEYIGDRKYQGYMRKEVLAEG